MEPFSGLHTPLCDLLGIRYPIVQAPMAGGWTTPELVAAVCNAGGLGMLAAARVTPDQLRQAIRTTKARTAQPFGVNLLLGGPGPGSRDIAGVQRSLDRVRAALGLPGGSTDLTPPPASLRELLAVIFDERIPLLSVAMGDPGPLVAEAHAAGVLVLASATTVEEAQRVVDEGADVVVAQGAEAGGHRSTFEVAPDGEVPLVGTMALIPQVVDAVRVPVLAAGGVADGRGVAAALALGAAGVQIGTRFLVARESGIFPSYRARLAAATEADTTVTRAFTGRPARAVRNRLLVEYLKDGPEPLAWPLQGIAADDIYRAARAADDAEYFPLLAGQALRLLKPEQGASEIVVELVQEARATISRLAGLVDPATSDRA